jgi:dTDP-4-amino-4,6-dideoxygalactose transaminase
MNPLAVLEPTVTKGATAHNAFFRPSFYYDSARAAFTDLLRRLLLTSGDVVLLPSYIGWSQREGSGVFDPVREVGTRYGFYALDQCLRIDLNDLARRVAQLKPSVVVLIHYFGFYDAALPRAVEIARSAGAIVVEDEAHAMLSDLVGGRCGRFGDVALYSLHKLLPVPNGGMLVLNSTRLAESLDLVRETADLRNVPSYDLVTIAQRRRSNARKLAKLIAPLAGHVDPLISELRSDVVPQSFPVRIRNVSRDEAYHRLNDAGFGVVSLYHTLINEIDSKSFPAAHELSRQVLNLPTHQDTDERSLKLLVKELARVVMS